mgnify:CR=1 FL=1
MLEKCIGALTKAMPNHGGSFSTSILNRKRENKKERKKKERQNKYREKKVRERELERMLTRLLSLLSRYGWLKMRL